MNSPAHRLKIHFRASHQGALIWAGGVLACLLVLWWQLGRWYQNQLLVEQKAIAAVHLAPYGNALTQSINRRFAILDGLAAFVHGELDSHGEVSNPDFQNFAGGVSVTVEGIRGLSIVPSAVQQFVFPLTGNEELVGMDLLDGTRPDVTDDVLRTIHLGHITLSSPYLSRDGETLVLVARLAMFRDQHFWGLVTMTLDVRAVLAEAGLTSPPDDLSIALRDADGHIFYGQDLVFEAEPVTFALNLPEGQWELASVPVQGWQQVIHPQFFFAHGSGLIVIILVTGLVYLTANRQQRLSDGITQRTQALHKALAQLEAIKENSPDLITMIDREGRYLMTNQAAADLLGRTPEQLIGQTLNDLFPPETADTFLQRVSTVFETEHPLSVEEEIPGEEDVAVFVTTLFPVFDQQGTCYAVGGIAKNITDRVRSERALRESEKRFRAIFEVATVGIVQVDTRDGQFIRCNATYCEITGYTADELRKMRFSDLTLPEDRETDWMLFTAAVRGEIPVYRNEKRYVRKDGSVVWVRLNAGFIRDATGQPVRTVAVCEDITERKMAQTEREQFLTQIRDQERQLRDVMSTVPEGVLLLNKEGRVLLANPVAERELARLANVRSGEVISHMGDRALTDLLTSPPKGMWHEVREGTRTYEIIARPVANGPEPEKWVLVVQDVTEERAVRKRTELQDRLASVGQLAAGIAHDFNNLIAVIALYAQMGVHDSNLPGRHQERLSVIFDQTQRAKDLVQQVLDFSRRSVLDRRPMDLLLFLKEQVKLLERTISEDIAINLNYNDSEYLVNADPTRMQQVVMNLAVNAHDAMPRGGQLGINLEYVEVGDPKKAPLSGMETGQWVRVTMNDTGEGIPAEALPHIFEPFFTTKPSGAGTGLGLAQVWGIVKQHEGFTDVETVEGAGTTFTLYLPALPVQATERLQVSAEGLTQGEGQVILVVEDNATLREALAESLLSLNYQVIQALSGREALEILEQRTDEVSLVLSDLVMPEMGGQALFHAMNARALAIPLVILSGHPMEDELKSLQEQGLAGWMLKPPDLAQLSRLLMRVLRK